jgi:hypothetical protein
MQFGDADEGTALIYKRENVTVNTYKLVLSGLESETTYVVYNYDAPETKIEMTGKALMTDGLEITINETPKAVIMMYSAK